MAWPQSRLTTYTTVDAVKPNDLNLMQDGIIVLTNRSEVRQLPMAPLASGENVATSTTTQYQQLPFDVGDVITSITAYRAIRSITGTAGLQLSLFRSWTAGADFSAGSMGMVHTSSVDNATVIGYREFTWNLTDTTIEAGRFYYLVWSFTGTHTTVLLGSAISYTLSPP